MYRKTVLFVLFFVLALSFQSIIVNGEYMVTEQEVNLSGDPSLIGATNVNVNNLSSSVQDTVVARWNRDMEDNVREGVFYGPIHEVTEFQYNYNNPSIVSNSDTLDSIYVNEKYYYLIIGTYLHITEKMVMNGASRFWIDIPAKPEPILAPCINGQYYGGRQQEWAFSYIKIGCPKDSGDYIWSTQSIYGYSTGGHFYVLMNVPLFPSIDHGVNDSYPIRIIYYLAYTKAPSIYLTGERLGRPEEDLSYRYINSLENNTFQRLGGGYGGNTNDTRIWYDHFTIMHKKYIDITFVDIIDGDDEYSIQNQSGVNFTYLPWDVSFGYSFIFEEGIGEGGVFGTTHSLVPNATIAYSQVLNKSSVVNDSYISAYLPFISQEPMVLESVTFNIFNFAGGAVPEFNDSTQTDVVNWTTDEYMDFLLVSSFKKVDVSTVTTDLEIRITIKIKNFWNGTFLHYIQDSVRDLAPVIIANNDSGDLFSYNTNIQSGVSLTSGQWNQISLRGDGLAYTVRYFPVSMYVGTNVFYIKGYDNRSTTVVVDQESYWDLAMEEFGQIGVKDWKFGTNIGHVVKGMQYLFQNGIQKVWSALETVYGWIESGLTKLMKGIQTVVDGLKDIGRIIYSWIQSFIGFLTNVYNFVKERTVPILQILFLVLVGTLALYVIGIGGKITLAIGGETE